MSPVEFIKTIYLGDRLCKSIDIDGTQGRIAIQVNLISRVRSSSGNWEYYDREDIEDGLLVFSGATGIRFDPSGPLPNDLINDLQVVDESSKFHRPAYLFRISISSVGAAGDSTEVIVEIQAEGIHLEDPKKPGIKIVD